LVSTSLLVAGVISLLVLFLINPIESIERSRQLVN